METRRFPGAKVVAAVVATAVIVGAVAYDNGRSSRTEQIELRLHGPAPKASTGPARIVLRARGVQLSAAEKPPVYRLIVDGAIVDAVTGR